jgi:hypothetical protein
VCCSVPGFAACGVPGTVAGNATQVGYGHDELGPTAHPGRHPVLHLLRLARRQPSAVPIRSRPELLHCKLPVDERGPAAVCPELRPDHPLRPRLSDPLPSKKKKPPRG